MRLRRLLGLGIPVLLGAHVVITAEVEPNGGAASATPVAIGDTVSGHIQPFGDVDWYRLQSSRNVMLEVDVDAQVLGSGIDALVHVYDSTGVEAPIAMLGVNDDDGSSRDSRLIVHLPYDGRYYVKMSSPNRHSSANRYRIILRNIPLDESEPNNNRSQADPFVAPGDSVFAVISPVGDRDWFALSVAGPAQLRVDILTEEVGATLRAPGVRVYAGTELLGETGGLHDKVSFFAPAAGTYYVEAFTAHGWTGTYYLTLDDRGRLGRGDPTSVLVRDAPMSPLAAAPGVIYAGAAGGIVRMDVETGATQPVYTGSGGFIQVRDFAVTHRGDLLVLEGHVYDATPATVSRLTPGGGKEEVLRGAFGNDIEVGWDDDLWVARSGSLGRYSLTSWELLSEAAIPPVRIEDLTIGAGGTPYVASAGAVYRAGSPGQAVFSPADGYVHGLAADMNGDLYLAITNRLGYWQDPYLWGEVWRIGADGTVHAAPVAASNLIAPFDLLFLINPSGATTARLIVSNIQQQARQPILVELAAAGVPVPGMPPSGPLQIGASLLEEAATDVLGGATLTPLLRSWVDQIGNRNDEFDVGDLAALRDWLIQHPSGTTLDPSTQGGSR